MRASLHRPLPLAVPVADQSAAALALDEAEFRRFHEATARPLRAYLRRSLPAGDVDDAMQEAYLRLLRTPHATLPVDQRRAYLYRIAANLVNDAWRGRKKAPESNDPSPEHLAARPSSESTRLDVSRAMESLRVQERTMMWLAYVEQASHREIALAVDVKEGSVKVLLSRARRKLAAALGVSR